MNAYFCLRPGNYWYTQQPATLQAPLITLSGGSESFQTNVEVPDVSQLSFTATSLTATSGSWLWVDTQGVSHILNSGSSIKDETAVSVASVRPVGQIILYSGLNYTGDTLSLYGESPTLIPAGFNDKAQSVRVVNGKWQLFQNINYQGANATIDGPASQSPIQGIANKSLSSLRCVL